MVSKGGPTVREATHAWIAGRVARREIMASTTKAYRDALGYFAESCGRHRLVSTLTRADVERFATEQGARRVSTDTLRMRLSAVRLWCTWALDEGLVEVELCRGMKLPPKPRSVPRGLKAEQVGKALAYARDTRERLLLSLMVREGLRALEVAGLDLGDIDVIERTLLVRRGKGGHQRLIPATDETLLLVEQYVAEERGRGAGRLIQSRRPGGAGSPADGVTAETVCTLAGQALHRVGIAESGHALRHTYAHGLIAAGAPVRDVQLALGHASIVTTQIYLPRADVGRLRSFIGKTEYHGDMLDEEQRRADSA